MIASASDFGAAGDLPGCVDAIPVAAAATEGSEIGRRYAVPPHRVVISKPGRDARVTGDLAGIIDAIRLAVDSEASDAVIESPRRSRPSR